MKLSMKTIRLFFACAFLLPFTFLAAQSTLAVEITGLENNKGKVIVALLDENEKDLSDQSSTIVNNTARVVFKNLKHGQYAIRYFHDENENRELDMNVLGIPKEGIGFSNNAMGKFGPKDFSEWLFDFSGDLTLKMSIRYLF